MIPENIESLIRSSLEILKHSSTSTEKEFLSIGGRLQLFYGRSQQIHQTCNSAAGLMGSETMEGNIATLNGLVAKMKGDIAEAGERLNSDLLSLRRVQQLLQDSRNPLNNLWRHVHFLWMAGISTRVENAWLRMNRRGFGFMADQVTRQSKIIAERMASLQDRLEETVRQVDLGLEQLLLLKERQQALGLRIIGKISSGLVNLADRQTASTASINAISSRSREITRNMGEVVSSLQFHDITRQQLEHIDEAVNGLLARSEERGITELFSLQGQHLKNVQEQIFSSVESIIANLGSISGNVSTMVGETLELAGASEGNGKSSMNGLSRDVMEAGLELAEYRKMTRELSSSMERAGEMLADMSSITKELDQISYSIKLIALNASVKAIAMGREGVALYVLAQAVQQLSVEAREQSIIVTNILRRVSAASGELGSGGTASDGAGESSVEAVIGEMERVLQAVRSANGESLLLLGELDDSGRALAVEIEETAAGISFHERVKEEINQTLSALELVSRLSPATNGGGDSDPAWESFQSDLTGKYTMEEERNVHRNWLDRMEGPPGSSSVNEHIRGAHIDAVDDTGLGENVELF